MPKSEAEKAGNALAKLGLTREPTVHRRVIAVVTYLRAVSPPHSSPPPRRPAAE